jgi:hypothetical protein
VVVWLGAEGKSITVGEPMLEVRSDKANVEVEATSSGTLAPVLACGNSLCGPPMFVRALSDPQRHGKRQ